MLKRLLFDFRLIGSLGLGPLPSNTNLIPQAPVILPVFPTSQPHSGQIINGGTNTVNTTRSLQRNHHQYSPSRFTLQKDCHVSDRCSWKCITIALIILCVALISILIYTAGEYIIPLTPCTLPYFLQVCKAKL